MTNPLFRKTILLALCCLFVSLSFLGSYTLGGGDMKYWISWIVNAEQQGIQLGYAENGDFYPPLALIFLSASYDVFMAFFGGHFNGDWYFQPELSEYFLSVKLLISLFLTATITIFYLISRNLFLSTLLFIFLFFNSVLVGLIDILFAPFFILSLWALRENRHIIFALFFTMAMFVKWQPLITLPFCLFYIINKNKPIWWQVNPKVTLQIFLTALSTFLMIFLFFGMPMVNSFLNATHDNFISGNALNFNWVFTWFLRKYHPHLFGGLTQNGEKIEYIRTHWSLIYTGIAIFYASYAVTFLRFIKKEKTFTSFLTYTGVGYLLYVTFNIGVHENHIFLAVILFGLLAGEDQKQTWMFVTVGMLQVSNLLLFIGIHLSFFNLSTSFVIDRILWKADISLYIALSGLFLVGFLFFKTHPERQKLSEQAKPLPTKHDLLS